MHRREFQAFADELAGRIKGCLDERNIATITRPTDLPRGVENAALGMAGGFVIRCLVDYDLATDKKWLRVDALIEWDG